MNPFARALLSAVALVAAAWSADARAQTPSAHPAAPPPAPMSPSTQEARHLSDAFVSVAEHVSPSVVQIDVTVHDERADLFSHFFGAPSEGEPIARGTGSGVVLSSDGAVLTNNHVVDSAMTILVRTRDGRALPGRLVGRDAATDLAVVKVDATDLVAAKFADSDAARVGEWVVAIGSPFGLGYTVTAGVLSAKGRGGLGMNAIEDYLQTDASINPGNSGGPLCNLAGEVLGINTMIVGRGQGIGFAVPSRMAQRVAEQILKTGHVARPWLGVAVQDVTPEIAAAIHLPTASGALVNNVADGSPAYKANVRPGDVIVALGGHEIRDRHDVIRETVSQQSGQPIALEIVRGGKHYGASVTLSEHPEPAADTTPPPAAPSGAHGMGFSVRDMQAPSGKSVAVVAQITPGSSSDRAGMHPGDVILEANGVADPSSAQVADLARSGSLLIRLKRGEFYFYAAIKR
jgi:Do/DeqQ family serine protease